MRQTKQQNTPSISNSKAQVCKLQLAQCSVRFCFVFWKIYIRPEGQSFLEANLKVRASLLVLIGVHIHILIYNRRTYICFCVYVYTALASGVVLARRARTRTHDWSCFGITPLVYGWWELSSSPLKSLQLRRGHDLDSIARRR